MTSTQHLLMPVSTYSRWLQVGGFLLAALLALVAPGTTDHADAVFDRHFHDPVTRSVIPLVDNHGHVHQVTPEQAAAQVGRLDASPGQTSFAAERAVPAFPDVPVPELVVLSLILLSAPLLTGHLIGPSPPPPRS